MSVADGGWDALVVVPAHDEEQLIGRCVRSVDRAAASAVRGGQRVLVVVVADACRDRTARLARRWLGPDDLVVEVDEGNVGRARAAGVHRGLLRLAGADRRRVWIASTDADSAVPEDWLVRQLGHAERGHAAVAGVVRVDSFAGHPPGTARRFHAVYRAGAHGHHHVHGANLGVRADAYLAVAGWPPEALAEDRALWIRLRRAGWPVLADSTLEVTTSGRPVGRAHGGFAASLRALAGGTSAGGAVGEPR